MSPRQLPPRDERGRFVRAPRPAAEIRQELTEMQDDLLTQVQIAKLIRYILVMVLCALFFKFSLNTVDALGEHLVRGVSGLRPAGWALASWAALVGASKLHGGRHA